MAYSASQLFRILLKDYSLLDFEIALSNNPNFRAVPISWKEISIEGHDVVVKHLDEEIVLTQSSFKMMSVKACMRDKDNYYPILFYEGDAAYITFSEVPDHADKDTLREAITEDIFYEVCSYLNINTRKKLIEFLKGGYKHFKNSNEIEDDYELISDTYLHKSRG